MEVAAAFSKLEQMILDLAHVVHEGFERIEARLSVVEVDIHELKSETRELNVRMGCVENRLGGVEERLDSLERAFDKDSVLLQTHERRITKLEHRFV